MFATSISLAPPLTKARNSARKTTTNGFVTGTRVQTITGPRPIERIMAGDLLLDAEGQIMELRGLKRRTAKAEDLVQIAPSALGLGLAPGCLHRGLTVGKGQKIALHDWRTELLYGQPALTPAQALVDGVHVQPCDRGAALYQLEFDRDCIIRANGLKALVNRSNTQTS